MYYNISEDHEFFLHLTYSLAESGYDVDDIIDFWYMDDLEKSHEMIESVVMSEYIDFSNKTFTGAAGYFLSENRVRNLWNFITKQGTKLKIRPRTAPTPTVTRQGRPITSGDSRPNVPGTRQVTGSGGGSTTQVTRGSGGSGTTTQVTGGGGTGVVDRLRNLPPGVKRGGAILGGAGAITLGGKVLMDRGAIPPEAQQPAQQPAPVKPSQPVDTKTDNEGNQTGGVDPSQQNPGYQPYEPYSGGSTGTTGTTGTNGSTANTDNRGWWSTPRQDLYKKSRGYQSTRNTYLNIRDNPIPPNFRDHYEVIADYLISEGHAETIEEAEYVMRQLDEEFIQSIIDNK